jgi:hypothetical protein
MGCLAHLNTYSPHSIPLPQSPRGVCSKSWSACMRNYHGGDTTHQPNSSKVYPLMQRNWKVGGHAYKGFGWRLVHICSDQGWACSPSLA